MMPRILKVKDWLEFGKPDLDGFCKHMKELKKNQLFINFPTFRKIVENYNISLDIAIDFVDVGAICKR